MLNGFILGIIVAASLVAAGFFFKFWRQTRDSLFLYFAASFCIEGINRTLLLIVDQPNEGHPAIYSVRLASYLVILFGMITKNLVKRP